MLLHITQAETDKFCSYSSGQDKRKKSAGAKKKKGVLKGIEKPKKSPVSHIHIHT